MNLDDRYQGAHSNVRFDNVTEWLLARLPAGARVLEIGPGDQPFPAATHLVDRKRWAALADERSFAAVDVEIEPLPFPDGHFDLVYCRHVVEDLHRPFLLLREMQRVARTGYVETPSPLTECTRGVDADGQAAWRGYHHHHWLVWAHAGRLKLLRKTIQLEHLELSRPIAPLLAQSPGLLNTYFYWDAPFVAEDATIDRIPDIDDIDVPQLPADYGERVVRALIESQASINAFLQQLPGVAGYDPAR